MCSRCHKRMAVVFITELLKNADSFSIKPFDHAGKTEIRVYYGGISFALGAFLLYLAYHHLSHIIITYLMHFHLFHVFSSIPRMSHVLLFISPNPINPPMYFSISSHKLAWINPTPTFKPLQYLLIIKWKLLIFLKAYTLNHTRFSTVPSS